MAKKSDPTIGATFVQGRDQTLDKDVIKRTGDDVSVPLEEFNGIAETIAGTNWVRKNIKDPGADEAFMFEPLLRTVDKYFETAKPAPLYIDEPKDRLDIERCQRKAQVMAEQGLRYAYITVQMSEEDVLAQLEKIDSTLSKKHAQSGLKGRGAA